MKTFTNIINMNMSCSFIVCIIGINVMFMDSFQDIANYKWKIFIIFTSGRKYIYFEKDGINTRFYI